MRQAHGRPALVDAAGSVHVLQAAVELDRGSAYKERFLQNLIFEHPRCLPVDEIEPGFGELVPVCTELPTATGYIDNLLMTADGDLVIVEAKLWRNSEARREVVAQALDYAAALFKLDYAGLEAAVLKASFTKRDRPKRLYDLFDGPDAKDEPEFIDAVNANLRLGRALILVVGDGIRTEAAQLGALVQSQAGAHFTFAMVELRVFQMPEGTGLLVCPRTLAQTVMIHRAVVQIDDRRAIVVAPTADAAASSKEPPQTITTEQFFEAMAKINPALPDKLRVFLDRLALLGVNAEIRRSLNLKWDTPSGKEVNLAYITRQGPLWTDVSVASLPQVKDLAHAYVEDLAAALGLKVDREAFGEIWTVRDHHGHAPQIGVIADKLDLWAQAIERLLNRLRARLAGQEE